MKQVRLIYNPNAGAGHDKESLLELIESFGMRCLHSSKKKEDLGASLAKWSRLHDLLIVAGGDGTVRHIVEAILAQKRLENIKPIALLPMGTSNNIAKSLGIEGQPESLVATWELAALKKIDVGRIYDFPWADFFIEGFGFGLFPRFIKAMKKTPRNKTPEENFRLSYDTLLDIVNTCPAKRYQLQIDGYDYSGNYILLEIMNTKAIGANLFLAPNADMGDGWLEIVLASEEDRDKLKSYFTAKSQQTEVPCGLKVIKGKSIRLGWDGKLAHVDDKLVRMEGSDHQFQVEVRESVVEFVV